MERYLGVGNSAIPKNKIRHDPRGIEHYDIFENENGYKIRCLKHFDENYVFMLFFGDEYSFLPYKETKMHFVNITKKDRV